MMHRRRWHIYLAAVALAALCFADAHAGDDGGGRSVFAFGAGNRPLGMGGAYAAIADDASAPLWNPGGIGLVLQKQLEVTQTGYHGFGVNEQFASLVVPSFRWGALSASFRHYGVGGVEERDERNVLIGNDLSDNQTEISLGYGKRLGDAWSLGGVAKLQSQRLAGFSGSGVGVDLGVIVKPLKLLMPNSRHGERFTVGVGVRNALEPEIRLANEGVVDPMGQRIGAAVLLPFYSDRQVLAAVDIEKSSRSNASVHAGLEFPISGNLALRTGFNNGELTAGANVGWHDIEVSYVFENTDVGGVSRLGISFAFGPTVLESRQATLDAEETRLQQSLAAAFEQRQSEGIEKLFAEAEASMQRGERSDALNTLAVVEALDPGNARARSLQIDYMMAMAADNESNGDYTDAMVAYSRVLNLAPEHAGAAAGYQRSRQMSDSQARRSDEIREKFDAALQAFSVQKLKSAREGFEAVLRMSPQDQAAGVMLERTNEAIKYRCAELVADAARFTEWGYFDEAQGSLAEASGLDPRAEGLARAEARLLREREKAQVESISESVGEVAVGQDPPAPQVATRRVLTESERREVERLYVQGTDAMSAGKREDAIGYLELVWLKDPTYRNTAEHLKRQYQTSGLDYFADGRIDRAEELWEKALRVDPTDKRTLSYLSRAREQRSRERQIFGRNE